MGISDFLTRVRESAGQMVDLHSYQDGIMQPVENTHKKRRRPMRIGIDVSSWVYNAAHGYGDMLADERHLSNYGRAALYDEQQQQRQNQALDPKSLNPSEEKIQEYVQTCTKYVLTRMELLRDTTKADVLVVLDGSSPPIKTREVDRRRALRREQEQVREQPVDPSESPTKSNQRRTKAFRRAGAGRYHNRIIEELLKALRQAELSFLVAPYEADSELAYLSNMGYIDLVVTEDSDLVAHGAKAILYKSLSEVATSNPRGWLLKFSDIGAVVADTNFYLEDFTPIMMTILFVSAGCDYCDKLKGIGLVTASRVIREAFCTPEQSSFRKRHHHGQSRLSRVLDELYVRCYMPATSVTQEFKRKYEERFLSAIFMYRHPIVYDPLQEDDVLTSRCIREKEQSLNGSIVDVVASNRQKDVVHIFADGELLEHEPYAELCRDFERIQSIVGNLRTKDEAVRVAQGFPTEEATAGSDDDAKDQGGDSQMAQGTEQEPQFLEKQEKTTTVNGKDNDEDEKTRDSTNDPNASSLHPGPKWEQDENDDPSDDGALETQHLAYSSEKTTARRLENDFLEGQEKTPKLEEGKPYQKVSPQTRASGRDAGGRHHGLPSKGR